MADKLSNPAQVRGDIQHGLTGDKRRGFDPAMAPMETDAEAAGTPMTSEQIEMARSSQIQGGPDRSSDEYSNAMRPTDPSADPPRQHSILLIGIASSAIVIVVIAYLLMR